MGGDILLFPELSWDRTRIDREGGRDRGLELQLSRSNGGRMDWSGSYALASSRDSIGGRMIPRASIRSTPCISTGPCARPAMRGD